MSYNLNFSGKFKISKPLEKEQIEYIQAFSKTKKVLRDSDLCEKVYDPIRLAVKLPVGYDGEFCVFGLNYLNKDYESDLTVLDTKYPPLNQPSNWCSWTCSDDGKYIIIVQDNKNVYMFFQWLTYILNNLLKFFDNRYIVGTVSFVGEDRLLNFGKIKAYKDRLEFYKQRVLIETYWSN